MQTKTNKGECEWCGGPASLCHCRNEVGPLTIEVQALAETMERVEALTEAEEDAMIGMLLKVQNDVLRVIVATEIKHLWVLAACVLAVREAKGA